MVGEPMVAVGPKWGTTAWGYMTLMEIQVLSNKGIGVINVS